MSNGVVCSWFTVPHKIVDDDYTFGTMCYLDVESVESSCSEEYMGTCSEYMLTYFGFCWTCGGA
jgi:hypothetical protein